MAIFPGEPGLAGTKILDFVGAKGDGGGGDNCSYKTCKSSIQTVTSSKPTLQLFKGRTPFLTPTQQCQSTEGIR